MLSVDAGNYFKPQGPDAAPINRLMVDSLELFPVRVLNLASDDLYLWSELSKLSSGRTQIISTNLSPRRAGVPKPARYAVVELDRAALRLPKPVRIGFLGLSDPATVKPNSGFTGEDPLQAVARVKPAVLEKADFLVVLGDLTRESARQIAAEHPEILAILLGERRFVLPPPEQVNNAVLLNGVERGRYLGRLTLKLDSRGQVVEFHPDFIELGQAVPEDPAMLRRQQETASAPRTP